MEYFSNYIWEKGNREDMPVSLVLQYAKVRKKSVLLACVCESGNASEVAVTESGYFTEGLVEWFHRSFLKLCEGKRQDEEVEKHLQKETGRLQEEVGRFVRKKGLQEQLHYWGILLWDNRFWIFCKGDCEGYLVNRRFQKKHLRRLGMQEQTEQTQWMSGRLQRKLGILLCTAGFMSHVEPDEAAEVLVLEGEASDVRLEKRLQELWQENLRRGENRAVGAIYLHT